MKKLQVEGWKVEKLGDVLQKTETVNPTLKPNHDFLYVDVSSVNNQTYSIEDVTQLKGKDAPSRARKLINTGDVIFATVRPTLKRIAIVPEEYDNQVCSTGYFVLRPRDFISNKYLFYFLLSDGFMEKMEKLQKGASYPAVTDNEVKSQMIAYPPLPEQQRIVSLLDETFAGLAQVHANAERNLVNAREVFEAVLESIDAEKQPLGNLVNITTGKLNANAAVEDGQYPFFTCAREIYSIDKYAFDCEAILLAGNNASGDFNVKHYKGKFNAYQRTYVITVNAENKIDYRWMYFQLLRSLQELKSKSVGANTKFLKLGMIQEMQIPLPPLEEQRAIVERLDALAAETSRLEAVYQSKLEAVEELKKSVLQKAFEGEL